MMYENVIFFNERTIRRYLPLEARNTEKIRAKSIIVDNDPQKLDRKEFSINDRRGDQDTSTSITNIQNSTVSEFNPKTVLSSAQMIETRKHPKK
jgi:hypothetical protein